MDPEVADLPQDIRADLATRGRQSLFFFAKGILKYKDLTLSCHGPLAEFLDTNKSRFKLILQPRGHFKTSLCTISRTLQKIVTNPEERILIVNESSGNSEHFLNTIKAHVETNRIFRALYPESCPKDTKKIRWSASELDFPRSGSYPEPTVTGLGMTSALTSQHFTHLCIDDPISEEAAKSEKVMHDAITRIDKVISLMVKPEVDSFDLIGTPWALHDVYSYFQSAYGGKLARFIRGAIEDDQPIFPELISLETLAQARRNMGEYMFSCLYMCNPRNADVQDFNIDDLRFWHYIEEGEYIVLSDPAGIQDKVVATSSLDISVTVDLAAAEKITSDRNAIVTVGVTPSGDAIILDAWGKRCSPLEVIQKLFELQKRYHPRVVGIEDVAYQKAFKHFVKAEADREGIYLNVRPITAKGKKELRIRGLQPILATGHLYALPTQHLLRNEMSEFPLGQFDDVLDALSMQQQLWRGIMSPQRWTKYKESEKQLLRRIDGYNLKNEDYPEDLVPQDIREWIIG